MVRGGRAGAGSLPVEDSDHPRWTSRASLQFVREVVDQEPPGRQQVGVGEVLQAPHVGLAQHLVGLELSGLTPVSAGSVDAQAGDVPLVHQPLGGLGRHSGEMKVFVVVLREAQSLRPPEISILLAVEFTSPRVEDHDGSGRDGTVILLPVLDVGHSEHRVGLGLSPGLDAYLDGGPGESFQGNVGRVPAVLEAEWSTLILIGTDLSRYCTLFGGTLLCWLV